MAIGPPSVATLTATLISRDISDDALVYGRACTEYIEGQRLDDNMRRHGCRLPRYPIEVFDVVRVTKGVAS